MKRSIRVMLVLALLLLVATTGCSSDDDSGVTVVCLRFIPSMDPTAGVVVAQTGPDSSCDTMELELIVTGVTDILGASFTINYPGVSGTDIAAFIQLIDSSESLLAQDGANLIVNATETVEGEVTVVITRESDVGVDANASNSLLARFLFFQTSAAGSGDVTFTAADLLGPGMPPVAKGIVFAGGTFVIAP